MRNPTGSQQDAGRWTSGAGTLRFQPWHSSAANGDLARAELAHATAVVSMPLFALGFSADR